MPPRDAIRRIVGLSLVEAMQALLPDAERRRSSHARRKGTRTSSSRCARAARSTRSRCSTASANWSSALADDGWLLGVATGKSDRGLAHVLATHGLAHHFVTLQTADRHPSKPHPSMIEAAIAEAGADPARTAMIGDTSYDVMMAVNAGVRAIGVGWGYHEPDELIAAGAHGVALAVADLPHHLEAR